MRAAARQADQSPCIARPAAAEEKPDPGLKHRPEAAHTQAERQSMALSWGQEIFLVKAPTTAWQGSGHDLRLTMSPAVNHGSAA